MVELYTQESIESEPRSHTEAMESPDSDRWRAAEAEETESLESRGTWKVVPRPKNVNIVSCKWVYRVKRGARGEVTRYKARLVARGFTQIHGLDYQDTFAPVTRLETLRLLLALAVEKDWEVRQIDVKSAYLYGDLDEEIYMEVPEGYDAPEGHVLLLKKALYGLKQAGRQWYLRLKEEMGKFGLVQVKSEPHMFVARKVVKNKRCTLIVPVYVDDLFPIGDKVLTDEFELWLPERFDITPPADAHFFLGIRFSRNRTTDDPDNGPFISLDQDTFVESVLARITVELREYETPMTSTADLVPNPDPIENADPYQVRRYQSAIGSLMYIMLGTRPDLAFAVGKLARFSSNPSVDHFRALTRVFCYLKFSKSTALLYAKHDNPLSKVPIGFCDADWANSKGKEDKRRSISGNIFFLSRGPFSWSSKKQDLTAESTMESEYISLWLAGRQASWIRNVFDAIGLPLEAPLRINCDSQSAIALANRGEAEHKGSKHFDVKWHGTRDRVERNEIEVKYCPTSDNFADILTKPLAKERFAFITGFLGLVETQNCLDRAVP